MFAGQQGPRDSVAAIVGEPHVSGCAALAHRCREPDIKPEQVPRHLGRRRADVCYLGRGRPVGPGAHQGHRGGALDSDGIGRAVQEREPRNEAQVSTIAYQLSGHRRQPAAGGGRTRTHLHDRSRGQARQPDAVAAAEARPRHLGHGCGYRDAVLTERRCCRPALSACRSSTWLSPRLARRRMPCRSLVSLGTPTGCCGSVSGDWASMSRQAIFTRPWAELATSRYSWPSWTNDTMSSGWFTAPSSATVRPTALAPSWRSASGKCTTGVQV